MATTSEIIAQAVERFQKEVPALAKLKLVFGLELRARGDTQLFRVEVPGPKVSKGYADDERLHIAITRSHFNELAKDGKLAHWREAYERGHLRVEGDPNIQRLIGQVIERHQARAQLRKAH
ncbi:MAG TPA: hypothetical protein VIL04_00670 [Solirubrobacterales bacterium]